MDLKALVNGLRTGFWFVPLLAATTYTGLAVALTGVDERLPFASDGAAAVLLSTLAGSLITLTGVVFSLTIITLHLASSQYGPRLLRTFLRDRGNQWALAILVGTFTYCVVALVSEPRLDDVVVAGAVVFFAIGIGSLIYFIHHVATSIQADALVRDIGKQLEDQIEWLYPDDAQLGAPLDEGKVVRADSAGYVTGFDEDRVRDRVEVLVVPGDRVLPGDALCRSRQAADGVVVVGAQRTESDDIQFTVEQVAQLAARALSPGINDPYTAASCLDQLAASFDLLADRTDGPMWRGHILMRRRSFEDLVEGGLAPFLSYASGEPIMSHVRRTLQRLSDRHPERSAFLERLGRALDGPGRSG